MASVGSLTSSTSNSIRGYGGLASGLDRDELIKGMTIGTTSKLNQQEQKKQKIEWMQEAVRAISDKMISFHGKYTETLTSSSNLFSSMLWGRNKITTTGTNSKYVSVSGTASSADAMTIMGIKQKARNASLSSSGIDSDTYKKALESGTIDTAKEYETLKGKTLNFSYEGKDYSITLGKDGEKLDTIDDVVTAINNHLGEQIIDKDSTPPKSLANLITVDTLKEDGTNNTVGFRFEIDKSDTEAIAGLKLTGGTALEYMGLENKEADLSNGTVSVVSDPAKVKLKKDFADMVQGQTLTFSYNGESASIQIDKDAKSLDEVKKSLQKSLDAKFGKDRILVEDDGTKLKFTTTVPGKTVRDADGKVTNYEVDKSSILKLTGGSSDAMTALELKNGQSNRTNLGAAISTDGVPSEKRKVEYEETDENGNKVKKEREETWYKYQINGTEVAVKEGSTINDLMNAINKSGANVTVTYQEAADKFTFTSREDGESGYISFKGNDKDQLNALNSMFGLNLDENTEDVRGQDAIVAVKYAGSDQAVELRRGTNSFTVDGLTINVKGEFGYTTVKDENGNDVKKLDPATEAIEVDATVDVDRLMSTIKSFIEDYNSIVDLVNGELTTKHDRDYDPLTSDQKEELSENEISKWETKAKEGLLYGDSDLRSLSMDLRVVVSGGLLVQFEKVGISLSSNYSDNGKLSIDETKLRAALETDPESVEKLFTSKAGVDAEGNETFNGLATNLKNVMNKYVKTTGSMEDKGILIRKAGSKSAALSLTQNTYYDQLTSIDKVIATLQARLKSEQDRYISQFSALETMINNMNSQASYLSSM